MAVEIRLLGRVDALVDGRSLPLGAPKQRAVLAMLALRVNRAVGSDVLIDGLWGDRPPQSAAKNVQYYGGGRLSFDFLETCGRMRVKGVGDPLRYEHSRLACPGRP